jgi:hypothetical protein
MRESVCVCVCACVCVTDSVFFWDHECVLVCRALAHARCVCLVVEVCFASLYIRGWFVDAGTYACVRTCVYASTYLRGCEYVPVCVILRSTRVVPCDHVCTFARVRPVHSPCVHV